MENTKIITNFGYNLEVIDNNNLLNFEIIEGLKNYKDTIFWNDIDCNYWIFDFKILNVWFEAKKIDVVNEYILLNAYN